jgi:glycosyltransferase involved in cell wall biosynthesis
VPSQVNMSFGAVVIGRNEGERLKRCLQSLSNASVIVYVDSGSTDRSVCEARALGAEVVELDLQAPFTAARARNAGFRRLREIAALNYVQFIDGDCELQRNWSAQALSCLASDSKIAVVCGQRRELFPDRSVYNWLCDQEWKGRPGEVPSCGGDAMMRVEAVNSVRGYRDDLIAGEEPELCLRLRAAGWRIWRLDCPMTFHDAAITKFRQWWRRSVRAGYAFAQGKHLHGRSTEQLWIWESRRAWLFGIWLPIICLVTGMMFSTWGWLSFLIFPFHLLQKAVRGTGPFKDRTRLAAFYVLIMFPQALGQVRFVLDQLFGHKRQIIEYK